MFDTELKMGEHVSHILRVGYFQLRLLRAIRKYLTSNVLKILVHVSVISRLDYANAIQYGKADTQIYCLHRLKNYAARVITDDSREVDSIEVLKNYTDYRSKQESGMRYCYLHLRPSITLAQCI